MIKFGVISDVDTAAGLVRVNFNDDEIVSNWIPFSMPKTLRDEYFSIPDIDEHVWCIMDEHCENGVVGGAIFSKSKKPSNGNKDKSYVKFDDGTTVTYDRVAHSLDIKIGSGEYQMKQAIYSVKIGTAEFKVENDGYTIKTASENLKSIISDLLDGLVALTVTASPGGGPTSPPINLATFTAIKVRLANLLK